MCLSRDPRSIPVRAVSSKREDNPSTLTHLPIYPPTQLPAYPTMHNQHEIPDVSLLQLAFAPRVVV
jgi:hypothetical protein